MLNPSEYLLLNFFDADVPKKFNYKSLTPEMKALGIDVSSSSKYPYATILLSFINKGWITREKNEKTGSHKATDPLYVLSNEGKKMLVEFESISREPDYLVLQYLDKMLPSLPVTTSFVVKEIIHHLNWSNEEVEEAKNLYAKIHGALVHTYQYAQEANYGWILTLREKGRDAKKEGGHFKYMEYLEQKDRSQPPSGTINIMRDNYGTAIQTGQELSLDKARIKPEIKNIKTNPPQKAKATSPLEYVAWIAAILGTIVAILAGLKIWPFNK